MRQGLKSYGPAPTPLDTVKRLWSWRDFIWALTAREIRARYVGSVGGAAWNIVQPLVLIAVFAVLFGSIFKMGFVGGGKGYLLYLVAALLPWNAFQDALQRSCNVYIEYSALVQKLPFPLESLVAQAIAAATVNLAISVGILFLFLPVLGVDYSISLLFLPIAVALQILLTIGPALAVATLTPFWRDVSPFTGLALFMGFWLTPIVYTPELLPAGLSWLIKLNPFYHVIRLYRAAWTGISFPTIAEIGSSAAVGLALMALGWLIFVRFHRRIPEML